MQNTKAPPTERKRNQLRNVTGKIISVFIVAAAASAVYVNTFDAAFAFDDNFAILYNGDVTNFKIPLWDLLKHDFWGQGIERDDSHKSYRPLTVFTFRLNHALGSKSDGPHAPDFHKVNVALHAAVSVVVYFVALHFGRLEQRGPSPFVEIYAIATAMLFALHPVHTEAVAGVVGRAELLSALFGLCALLLYFRAAAARHPATSRVLTVQALLLASAATLAKETGFTFLGAFVAYEALAYVAPPGALACALGKLVEEAPPAPAAPPPPPPQREPDAALRRRKGGAQRSSEKPPPPPPPPATEGGRLTAEMAAERIALTLAAAAAYLWMRRRIVGGDTLVKIYRKVENPLAFMPGRGARLLSTAHLHWRYAWLLLWPQHLSADWSFACIVPVTSVLDHRNLGPALLYSGCLLLAARARPWDLLPPMLGGAARAAAGGGAGASSGGGGAAGAASRALLPARVALWQLLALALGPFLPAANIFFYVGTYIGERLLYLPSVAFCLLIARPIARALCGSAADADVGDGGGAEGRSTACSDGAGADTRGQSEGTLGEGGGDGNSAVSAGAPARDDAGAREERATRAAAAAALLVALLLGYGARTWARNFDWVDEEQLFKSALIVCPNSAKVRLNAGILSRRYQDWGGALEHFRRAQEIEPTYCEPTYWIGATLVNMNQIGAGLDRLEQALDCKYVAVEAAKALSTVFQENPKAASVFAGHARLLTKMERPDEACEAWNNAAALEEEAGRPQEAARHRAHCLPATKDLQSCAARAQLLRSRLEALDGDGAVEGGAAAKEALARGRAAAIHGFIRENGPTCRGKRAYSMVINELQNGDPYDPWLHREWARLLTLELRFREGMLHLEAAMALFARRSDIDARRREEETAATKAVAVQVAAAIRAVAAEKGEVVGAAEVGRSARAAAEAEAAARGSPGVTWLAEDSGAEQSPSWGDDGDEGDDEW